MSCGEQIGEQTAQRVDVDGAVGGARNLDVAVDGGPLPHGGGEPQIEQAVVGGAVPRPAQQRAGEALAHHLAVEQVECGEHVAGVDGLRRPDRDAPRPQRLDEPDQVARNTVRGKRGHA